MTIDVDRVKASVDVLRVAEGYADLRRSGRAWVGRCPLPGHDDRSPSFAVYEDTQSWHCFGCGEGGDVIALVMAMEGANFREACERLGDTSFTPQRANHRVAPTRPVEDEGPPSMDWQLSAERVVEAAMDNLWSGVGVRAMRYLTETRGLDDRIIEEARLGYVPGGPRAWVEVEGMTVPCGIVIPWVCEDVVWSLKVRRATGKPKYVQAKGGSAGGLYRIDRVQDWQDVLILEGEFDALVVAQATKVVAPVALGTATNTIRARWLPWLVRNPTIYARLDGDKAGDAGVKRLQSLSERVRRVQVPEPHKDVNEFYLADREAFGVWVRTLGSWRDGDNEFYGRIK